LLNSSQNELIGAKVKIIRSESQIDELEGMSTEKT